MNLDELAKLKNSNEVLPFPIRSKSLKWRRKIINHKIAIPVVSIASFFKNNYDISIIHPNLQEIGILCFTKEIGPISWNELTENQYVAFLTEANYNDKDSAYLFSNNYLVIKEQFYLEYVEKFMTESALWGNFFHGNPDINIETYKVDITEIKISQAKFDTSIFLENSVRAILQPFAFERYLKFYHLLELRFDVDVIKRIKLLDLETNTKAIGELLNDYKNKEFNRLLDILENYCTDIDSITERLNKVSSFYDIAIDIFYRFGTGKENNPLKEEALFAIISQSGFDEQILINNGFHYQRNYRGFILKLAAYWIYRVRCSVAHNKIGEYILTKTQENFIADFAEPLLKQVLLQCFRS